jgi:Stress responsive A/B Barrel Domain
MRAAYNAVCGSRAWMRRNQSNLTKIKQKDVGQKNMFVHSVYFWLKPDLTEEQRAKFWESVRSLTTIESVRQGFVGSPASTDRPIIDRSYSCALIVIFDDDAGHDAYQVHPVHDKFREECAPFWSKVLIYDAVN